MLEKRLGDVKKEIQEQGRFRREREGWVMGSGSFDSGRGKRGRGYVDGEGGRGYVGRDCERGGRGWSWDS